MSTFIRRTSLGSAALVLALTLAGCGGDDDDPDDSASQSPSPSTSESPSPSTSQSASPTPSQSASPSPSQPAGPVVLSQRQADAATLTAADVGRGFTADREDDPDGLDLDDDLGCLRALRVLADANARTRSETTIDSDADPETAERSVLSVVASYADTATIERAFARFRRSAEGCDSVNVTDDDDVRITLDVTSSTGRPIGAVDEQVSLRGTGTIREGRRSLPYRVAFTASRIENNLSVVGLVDEGRTGKDIMPRLTRTAVARLNAAIG